MTPDEAIQVYVQLHGDYLWEMHEILWEAERLGRPDTVLEIGAHRGDSLRIWRAAWDPTLMIGIDLDRFALDWVHDELNATLIEGRSQDAEIYAQVLHHLCGHLVDFLYIDGDHTFDAVTEDWRLYAPLVRPGGLIVLHDAVITWNDQVDVYQLYPELRKGRRSKLLFDGGDPADPYCKTTGAALFYP